MEREKKMKFPFHASYAHYLSDNHDVKVYNEKLKVVQSLIEEAIGKGEYECWVNFDIPSELINELGIKGFTIEPNYNIEEKHYDYIIRW